MKGLFKNSRNLNRDFVKALQDKATKVKKSNTTIKKGGSLITKIQNICNSVQSILGHYEQQLELITSKERLHEYIDNCIKNDIIAIDTETTGLDAISDKIVGVCIYTRNEKPAYIPINHISYITQNRLSNQLEIEQMREEFQRLVDAKTKIVMFNAKFDIRVIRHQLGVNMIPSWCGFIASKCLKNNEEEGNLKYLWKKYCSQDKDAAHFTFDKMFEGINFALIPMETAYLYAAKDALMTLELYDFQKPYLTEDDPKCIECGFQRIAKLYHEIELPIIPIVADVEDAGVTIDLEYCKQLSEKYDILLKEAENKFHKELNNYRDQLISYLNTHPETKLEDPINIASPTQLAELFYDVFQLPAVSRKKPRGTGVEEIEKLNHPLGKLILDHREVAKLLNTYIEKMPTIINKKTGRIHCSFNQYGTDCIIGNSHLVTDNGVYTFKELLDDICIEDGTYYEFKHQILNKDRQWENSAYAIKYNDVNTLKIKGQYGFEIEGTYNHPIMVANLNYNNESKNQKQLIDFWQGKQFKQLDQIKLGDYIEIPCGWEWPQVDYLPTNLQGNYLNSNNTEELNYPKFYNEELAEFLGIYYVYGPHRNSKQEFFITISNDALDVYNRLVYLCKSLFNVIPAKEDNGNKYINIRIKLPHVRSLGNIFDKTALNKRIPNEIRHSNKEVIKAYLKGMSLNYNRFSNKLLITVRNKEDAQFIQMFLCSQGILSEVRDAAYKDKQKEIYRIYLYGENLNLFLSLVHNIEENKTIKTKSNTRYKNIKIDNSFRIKVESIEKTKNTVYDINVPQTHSFICNSMINHNTGRFSSSNPNLQNIPSHNKDIRPMFIGAVNKDITCNDQCFELLYCDKVNTIQGKKYSQDLQVGDVLICDDGNYSITNIEVENQFIRVYI